MKVIILFYLLCTFISAIISTKLDSIIPTVSVLLAFIIGAILYVLFLCYPI